MENSKLIPLLQSLDKEELKLFGRFVKSKVYNPNKNLIKLYEELKKYYPEFRERNIEQEKIYGRIFPGKPFHIGIMRNLISDMMQLVKDFFVYHEFTKDSFRQKYYLLKELNRKDLYKFFEKEYSFAESGYKKKKIFDERLELDMYDIYGIKADYLKKNLPSGKTGQYYEMVGKQIDKLSQFFIVTYLKDSFKLLCGKTNSEINTPLKDEILSHVEKNKNKYFENPVIDILYHFVKLVEKGTDDKLFETVKKKIYDNEKRIQKAYLKNLFQELANYSRRRELSGETKFVKEQFDIEKEMLACGLYFDSDGYLPVDAYTSITITANNSKEFDWAEKFLYEYKDKLRRKERNNAYNYNMALKFYSQGRTSKEPVQKIYFYETALNLLTMIRVDDYYYEVRVKTLQIQMYYEMDEVQRTIFFLDTLKHYLKKNKEMPRDIKEGYKSFANHVHELIKFKAGSAKITTDEFRRSVNEAEQLTYRSWLISEIDQIESSRKKTKGHKPPKE